MSKLPFGWITASIGAFTIDCDQHIPEEVEAFKYIDISSVNRNTKHIEDPKTLIGKDAPSRARKRVCAGNVLVSMTRPNLNAVALVPDNLDSQIASTGFDVLRAADIDPRWVFNLVRTTTFVDAMSELVQGALYPAIRSKDIRGFAAPLAPLNEQKRIADKLDAVLARVDACRDRLPVIIKRFRQSVLDAATSGKLTEEWRESCCCEDSWTNINVGALLSDIRYGTAKKCHYEPQATPVIRIPNIFNGSISHADLKYAEFDDGELQKLSLAAGDILMIRSNGSVDLVGRTALVAKTDEGFLYAGYLIRLRVNPQIVNPAYLSIALAAPKTRYAIELTARSTSGVNNINTEEIRALDIELPYLTEQAEIVRRVESLFAYADRLEARYTAARAQVEKLSPALLAKAFRGELVPQDPNDEPTSELLARIAASKSEAQPEKRASRKRKNQPQSAVTLNESNESSK
jgi:type I restriction enzyme S subunit